MGEPVRLGEIQEILLIPLYGRAQDARGPHSVLGNRRAVELVEAIDYDFARFRGPSLAGSVLRAAIHFPEGRVHAVLRDWVRRFPGSSTAFDTGGPSMMKTQDRNPVFRAVSARMKWTCGKPAELAALGLTLRESRTFGTPHPAVAARSAANPAAPLRLGAPGRHLQAEPLPRLSYQLPRPRSSEPSCVHRRRTAPRTRPRIVGAGAGTRTGTASGRRNRAGAIIQAPPRAVGIAWCRV